MAQMPHNGAGGSGEAIVADSFAVDFGQALPCGGGLPAFAARDLRTGQALLAIRAHPDAPPRAHALQKVAGLVLPGLLATLGHGVARSAGAPDSYVVICRVPEGAALGAALADGGGIARVWSEAELIGCVLRPMAAVLAELLSVRLTHRAIRADNVFQPAPGRPVVLGCGWAAPPAAHQPAASEPPYVACCHPLGRGEGSAADDVYALGVLILSLAAGRPAMAGLADAEVVRQKLARGSVVALTASLGLAGPVAELVAGMLAEDPAHRPSPAQLGDPGLMRARRVAARPPRRGQRPFEATGQPLWDIRSLAFALAEAPAAAAALLRGGAIEHWLRHTLQEPVLASRLEAVAQLHAAGDPLHLARAVSVLDPLAPLCWEEWRLFPDGLGPLLAGLPAAQDSLRRMIEAEGLEGWTAFVARSDIAVLRVQARQMRAVLRKRGWGGGLAALRLALNPLLPCRMAAAGTRLVLSASDMVHALEARAASAERGPVPMDAQAAALLAAREPLFMARELADMEPAAGPGGAAALAQLRVLARVQKQARAVSLPGLAGWLLEGLRTMLDAWPGRTRRAALVRRLGEAASAGRLGDMLDLLDDGASRTRDEQEAAAAREAAAAIDATLARLAQARAQAEQRAARIGHEVAAALGVIAVSVVALMLALT